MLNKALIIGILLFGATFSVSANEIVRWEYMWREYQLPSTMIVNADAYGVVGWELVEVVYDRDLKFSFIAFFKRKKTLGDG